MSTKKERKWKQLQWEDRIRIESFRRAGLRNAEIARLIGVDRSTIGRELERGAYEHTNSDLTTERRYSADLAQERYEKKLLHRGTQLKIGKDLKYARYLEEKILSGMSPAAVLGELEATGKAREFDTRICVGTLYSYIDKGVFLTLSNSDLWVKGKRKKHKKKVERQKRASAGTSISNRPEEIDSREEFGHWEMDSVVGPQGKSKSTMLTLTERKTRDEVIVKLANHGAAAVVDAINTLQKRWGDLFPKVFKSITVDNGVEFSAWEKMELGEDGNKRTEVYYCHAYSSWERGTNENHNRMIRRFIPKGVNFDDYDESKFDEIATWMNNYPRRIFGWKTPAQLFEKELAALQ